MIPDPIQVLGPISGTEREAAEELRRRFRTIVNAGDRITIVAAAKCYGQVRKDVDLIVFGTFGSPLLSLPPTQLEEKFRDRKCSVLSFALVVEVKDHDPSGVRIEGSKVQVRYKERWHDASEQVFQERDSVLRCLEAAGHRPPKIADAIWLRNVTKTSLPAIGNVFFADSNALDLVGISVRANPVLLNVQRNKDCPEFRVSCVPTNGNLHAAMHLFTRELHPSAIDRRRLDAICRQVVRGQQYLELLGQQALLLRGRGGTGKTIRLLQIAKLRYDEFGDRSLILTYNHALAADLRRLLALLGVSDHAHQPAIVVQTSVSFFFGLLKEHGLGPERPSEGGFPPDYAAKKEQLLRRISEGGVGSGGLASASAFGLVFVDEAQDWPRVDRDLLLATFGPKRLVLADGVDQFVTGHPSCDWQSAVGDARQIVPLRKALRLKSNLCRFATAFAERLGFDWDLEVNDEVGGGRVVVVRGHYDRALHDRLMAAHAQAGNEPIDALFVGTGSGGAQSRDFTQTLRSWGKAVWDGVSPESRQTYPTELAQHRVVRYESSRGLEGWTVVCLDIDLFFDRQAHSVDVARANLYQRPEEVARQHAVRWCMIPLTRAIDTLVLQVTPGSYLDQVLCELATAMPDFVERLDTLADC